MSISAEHELTAMHRQMVALRQQLADVSQAYVLAGEREHELRIQLKASEARNAAFIHRAGDVVEALDGGLMSVSMTARVRKLKALVLAQSAPATDEQGESSLTPSQQGDAINREHRAKTDEQEAGS